MLRARVCDGRVTALDARARCERRGFGYARLVKPTSVLVLGALSLVLTASACDTQPKIDPPPAPLDSATAQEILLRNLQAVEAGDVEATKADLFPRDSRVLVPCAKVRVANFVTANKISVQMPGLDGGAGSAPVKLTGVTLNGAPAAQGNFYSVSYSGVGNSAFGGSETFIWANGRWWIRCNV